jgi:hypothetical protein
MKSNKERIRMRDGVSTYILENDGGGRQHDRQGQYIG